MQRPETIRAIAPVVDLTRQMEMVQNAIVPVMEMSRQMKAIQSTVAANMARQMTMTRDVIGSALEMSRQIKMLQGAITADMSRQVKMIQSVIATLAESPVYRISTSLVPTISKMIADQARIFEHVREQVRRELEYDASRRGVTFDELLNAIEAGVLIIVDPEELAYGRTFMPGTVTTWVSSAPGRSSSRTYRRSIGSALASLRDRRRRFAPCSRG